MKIKTIMISMLLVLGMTLFAHADPVSMGHGNSELTQKLNEEFITSLIVKKMSGTIKWSKGAVSKSTTIATANTGVEDLSFINVEGLSLAAIFKFVETGWAWNTLTLSKVNKGKTVAKFLYKDKHAHQSHIVIMKLKKGVFTLIIKNKGGDDLHEMLGLTNTGTEGWVPKTLGVVLDVSNGGTTISGNGHVHFIYQTKQDKVTKIKAIKGVM